MKVEYYKPEKIDLQKPHAQDELYIVASGSGTFIRSDEKVPANPMMYYLYRGTSTALKILQMILRPG